MATQAKPRRKVPRAVREGQMLEVARRTFGSRGYHDVSMDEIAEAVGISKPMLYAYFDSKEGLCRACIRQARRLLYDAINEGVDAAAQPDDQLWLGICAFFTFVEEESDSWTILLGEATAGVAPLARDVAEVRRDIADGIRPLLRAAVAAEGGDPIRVEATQPLAHALIGAGQSLAEWWVANPGLSRDSVARLLMNFAWLGFGDLVRGDTWEAENVPRSRPRT
jgi:AcrR family transcriptional regulator